MTTEPESKSLLDQIRETVARIALISHAPTQAYDGREPSDTSEDIGGKRPPGTDQDRPRRPKDGADEKAWAEYHEDMMFWETSYQRKTPEYFARRLGAFPSEARQRSVLMEAKAVLLAWQRQPIPKGQPPEFGSAQWKRWVAESDKDGGELARLFNTTRQYIGQVRKAYRDAA